MPVACQFAPSVTNPAPIATIQPDKENPRGRRNRAGEMSHSLPEERIVNDVIHPPDPQINEIPTWSRERCLSFLLINVHPDLPHRDEVIARLESLPKPPREKPFDDRNEPAKIHFPLSDKAFMRDAGKVVPLKPANGETRTPPREVKARVAPSAPVIPADVAEIMATVTAPVAPKAVGIRLLRRKDLASEPKRKYLIKGMLAAGDVACIIGQPGSGKSIIGPYLGHRVAQGETAFGRKTRAGPVFYIPGEDPHGMRERFEGLFATYGDTDDLILVDGITNLMDTDQRTALHALVAAHKPALIIIDTLAATFYGINENDSQAMNEVGNTARALTQYGAAVILVHHTTKADDGTPRGHSVLNGALDVSLHLGNKDDNGIIRGKLMKNRNGRPDIALAFRIESVVIGKDEDDDDIDTPVLREAVATAKAAKLPRGADHALGILLTLIAATDGKPITFEEWSDTCTEGRDVSSSPEQDSRAKAFRRAFDTLKDRQKVNYKDGFVSVINGQPDFPCSGMADGPENGGFSPDNDEIPY